MSVSIVLWVLVQAWKKKRHYGWM